MKIKKVKVLKTKSQVNLVMENGDKHQLDHNHRVRVMRGDVGEFTSLAKNLEVDDEVFDFNTAPMPAPGVIRRPALKEAKLVAKVKFMVIKNGMKIVVTVGDRGCFDTYELAEAACRELAVSSADVIGPPPYYEIKKIFTV